MKNYYTILEVPEDASQQDIKKAYYRQANRYHPDKNNACPNAEARFKEVNEAYSILSKADKKQQYDWLLLKVRQRLNRHSHSLWSDLFDDQNQTFYEYDNLQQQHISQWQWEFEQQLENLLSDFRRLSESFFAKHQQSSKKDRNHIHFDMRR